jgi:phosphoglucomutase
MSGVGSSALLASDFRKTVWRESDRGQGPAISGRNILRHAAEILNAHGITPLLVAAPAPTPAIAYAVIRKKADGAINFTASHNLPEYNGIKFSSPDGAPAFPEVTKRIEAEMPVHRRAGKTPAARPHINSQSLEPCGPYLAHLREVIDLDSIKKANLRVVFDPFWVACAGLCRFSIAWSGRERQYYPRLSRRSFWRPRS